MRLETISDTATGETADFPEELNNELDLPPEYHHYRDEGCEMASVYLGYQSSCLNCPFPKCVYDQYGGKQRWLNQLRDREMALGRKVAVIFFDNHNPKEAVVIAVYT